MFLQCIEMEMYGKVSFICEGVQLILLTVACADRKHHILLLGATKKVKQSISRKEKEIAS